MQKGFFLLLSIVGIVHAGSPVWTFTPLTATNISIPKNGTATVKYNVTNKSRKNHTLIMEPIAGINQDTSGNNCKSPFNLAYQQSCTLALNVTASQLLGSYSGGPIVCDQSSNHIQCYQPSLADQLNIQLTSDQYTVGGNLSGINGTIYLENNNSDPLSLSNNGAFIFSQALNNGATYQVTISAQPSLQTCTIMNGTGIIN
jgi:hypothetical protein